MKSKKAQEIYKATESMLKQWPQTESISSDRGSEFKSSTFQELLSSNNVGHFFVGGSGKGTVIESFIRYLRSRLARYKFQNKTATYITVLQQIIENYNETGHSSTRFKPNEVNEYNQCAVFENLFLK